MSSGFRITFTDPRRFGFMDLLTPRELAEHPALGRLGPEPLSSAFDAAALARACRGKKTSLKAALLDQRVVAGLGNIYVSEALHRARLSPLRLASTIATASGAPRPAAVRLAAAIKQVLEQAIARSAKAYRRGDRFRVYDRTGEPCRHVRCRGTIAQRTQAGRYDFLLSGLSALAASSSPKNIIRRLLDDTNYPGQHTRVCRNHRPRRRADQP